MRAYHDGTEASNKCRGCFTFGMVETSGAGLEGLTKRNNFEDKTKPLASQHAFYFEEQCLVMSATTHMVVQREHLGLRRGYLAVRCHEINSLVDELGLSSISIPDQSIQNCRDRNGSAHYHITLLSAKEILRKEIVDDFENTLEGKPWLPLGIGETAGCYFIVVNFPHANALRRKWGLPSKDFHITLGFAKADRHDVSKGCETIVHFFEPSLVQARRWLQLARDNLVLLRKNDDAGFGLQETNCLLSSLVCAVQMTHPKAVDLLRELLLCWCNAAGRAEDFSGVVDAATKMIQLKETDASGWGYLGHALFKLERYGEAITSLEQAYTLFGTSTPKNQELKKAREVERNLIACCLKLGRDPPVPPLLKFPRTSHLFDLGAATSDDQVLARDSAMQTRMTNSDSVVIIQEKVDGANLGISLSLNGRDILVQNRSHYIHSGDHAQFGQLTQWVEVHREALLRVLDAPNGRSSFHGWVLFGEWLVARHSIPYAKLPGYFLAFDLYDIATGRFVSQTRLRNIMRGSEIPLVRTISVRTFQSGTSDRELMDLLNTESAFRTDGGPVEGVVFRIDDGDWLSHRSKLVRPDFIAGCAEGHWMRRKIEKQTVDVSFAEEYLQSCYPEENCTGIPCEVEDPRKRFVVVYNSTEEEQPNASPKLCTQPQNAPPRPGRTVTLQRNLSWLWANEVAVSSTPKSAEQVQALHDAMNIGLVITLTKEEPLEQSWFNDSIRNHFVPMPNYFPPTSYEQQDEIGDAVVRSVVASSAVLEHCGGGKGRAGTVAACLLLRFGYDGIWSRIRAENPRPTALSLRPRPPFMTSDQAIAEIRRLRPGSIETEMQEDFVRDYAQHLWRQAAETEEHWLGEGTSERQADPIKKEVAPSNRRPPKYVVMAGIPGSGKSSFARLLAGDTSLTRYVLASQDDMGHKSCEDFVGRMSASVARGDDLHRGIVVDCTNVTEEHRRRWLAIMHNPPSADVALVFMDAAVDICAVRVAARVDHPSIPFGRGERIIRGFARNLQPPSDKERKSLFSSVHVIRTIEGSHQLLSSWGISR